MRREATTKRQGWSPTQIPRQNYSKPRMVCLGDYQVTGERKVVKDFSSVMPRLNNRILMSKFPLNRSFFNKEEKQKLATLDIDTNQNDLTELLANKRPSWEDKAPTSDSEIGMFKICPPRCSSVRESKEIPSSQDFYISELTELKLTPRSPMETELANLKREHSPIHRESHKPEEPNRQSYADELLSYFWKKDQEFKNENLTKHFVKLQKGIEKNKEAQRNHKRILQRDIAEFKNNSLMRKVPSKIERNFVNSSINNKRSNQNPLETLKNACTLFNPNQNNDQKEKQVTSSEISDSYVGSDLDATNIRTPHNERNTDNGTYSGNVSKILVSKGNIHLPSKKSFHFIEQTKPVNNQPNSYLNESERPEKISETKQMKTENGSSTPVLRKQGKKPEKADVGLRFCEHEFNNIFKIINYLDNEEDIVNRRKEFRKQIKDMKDRAKDDIAAKDDDEENILSKFEIGEVLGEGSYGLVKLASLKDKPNSLYAIKAYRKVKLVDKVRLKNLELEVEILSSIDHPNVIKLFERIDGLRNVFLVMEFVAKESLQDLLEKQPAGRFSEAKVRRMMIQLVGAVAYLHSRNMVHRDLKLQNVLVNSDYNLKLIDFGFATRVESGTLLNVYCGTPSYMSPEIVSRTPYAGKSSDIWALGCLLVKLTTGTFPFRGTSEQDLFQRISEGNFILPVSLSSNLQQLIKKMLTLDPLNRITAEDILSHPWMLYQKPNDQ